MFCLFSKGGKGCEHTLCFCVCSQAFYLPKGACDRLCVQVRFVADSKILVKLFTSQVYYQFSCFDTIDYIFFFRTLRKAELPISEDTDCQQAFKVFNGTTQICAGGVKGETTENTARYSYFPPILIDHFKLQNT